MFSTALLMFSSKTRADHHHSKPSPCTHVLFPPLNTPYIFRIAAGTVDERKRTPNYSSNFYCTRLLDPPYILLSIVHTLLRNCCFPLSSPYPLYLHSSFSFPLSLSLLSSSYSSSAPLLFSTGRLQSAKTKTLQKNPEDFANGPQKDPPQGGPQQGRGRWRRGIRIQE